MSDNREQLQEQIKVQGEVVRKLKAAKESKEKVSSRISDAIFLFFRWFFGNKLRVSDFMCLEQDFQQL